MKIFGNKKTPAQVLTTEPSKNSGSMATKQVRYEALVKALHGDLYRYAYWLTHEKQVAEDLVQEDIFKSMACA